MMNQNKRLHHVLLGFYNKFLFHLVIFNLFELMQSNEQSSITTTSSTISATLSSIYTSSSTEMTNTDGDLDNTKISNRFACDTHENCSVRVLTLDSYCCQVTSHCCNWLEFVVSLNRFNTTQAYKPPTSLTIFTLLIILICFMFIAYCFCVLFCYCFKCGLFKRPKIVVISTMPSTSNGSDTTSAEMISPKYSLSSSPSSSSSTSSVNYSSRNHRNRHRATSSSSYKQNKHVARAMSNHNNGKSNRRNSLTNNSSSRKTRGGVSSKRSPTARASSNSTSQSRRHNSNSAQSSQQRQHLYADPHCYIDYDNDTPFLIQQSNEQKRQQPKHSKHSKSYRTNYSSSVQVGNQSRSSGVGSSHPIGTAVALVDDDFSNSNNPTNQLETIAASQTNTLSRSSSSIDFGVSLMEAVETTVETNEQQAPSYYLDEMPPAYDEIIKNMTDKKI